MDSDIQTQSLFTSDFDTNTPENIVQLDQRLKGLRAEIEIQLHNFAFYEGEDKDQYIEKFSRLAKEIDEAISGIETIVNAVRPQSDEFKREFFQSEEIQELDSKLGEHLEKFENIKIG